MDVPFYNTIPNLPRSQFQCRHCTLIYKKKNISKAQHMLECTGLNLITRGYSDSNQ
ncbi:hypothetical protein BDC45DRAFT_509615 [Circinella umbellata]|nr:hypothetical protein BDC45DRAFT_521530 [Circinella umbellata]KAI7854021.1 hypothetical protein BDC45DRAFT_509615 [Circinella umbellata]